MFAFDAATGASIWNMSRAGNTGPVYYPAYVDGAIFAPEFFEITKMDAEEPYTTGEAEVPDFTYSNRMLGVRYWAAWLGYQIQGSVAYADDLTGDKIYAGSDIGSAYCLNATDGSTWSVFTAGGNIPCSPTIWDGKMYIGCTDGTMYCFDDSPVVCMNMWAAANKGVEMWNNETLSIGGRLTASPTMSVWNYDTLKYEPVPSEYEPGIPNAEIIISLNKPDGSAQNLTAMTDKDGYFTVDYNPTAVGEWGWLAFYEGKRTVGLRYSEAYSEFTSLTVDPAPSGSQQTPAPTENPTGTAAPPTASAEPTETGAAGIPMEYVYAVVAVVVVVILIVAAYVYIKRK